MRWQQQAAWNGPCRAAAGTTSACRRRPRRECGSGSRCTRLITMSKAFTAYDVQRRKLDKLMSDPEKPVPIPESRGERKFPDAPDFVRNIMGSSAGAGSGEFHVYRHLRRKEYARQRFIKEQARREDADAAFEERVRQKAAEAEARTAKKRAKRLKRKQRVKVKKTSSGVGQESESEEDTDEDEEAGNTDKGSGPVPVLEPAASGECIDHVSPVCIAIAENDDFEHIGFPIGAAMP